MPEPPETPHHYKRRLEASDRERHLLEREIQLLELQIERAKHQKELTAAQTEGHSYGRQGSEDDRIAKEKFTSALLEAVNDWIDTKHLRPPLLDLEGPKVGPKIADLLVKEAINDYVDHEWSAHLREKYSSKGTHQKTGGDETAEEDEKTLQPDHPLVLRAVEYALDHRNAYLDSEGSAFERSKGPLGRRENAWRRFGDWAMNATWGQTIAVIATPLGFAAIVSFLGILTAPAIIVLWAAALIPIIIGILAALPNSRKLWFVLLGRGDNEKVFLEKHKEHRKLHVRTWGTPTRYDIDGERQHYHLHDVLARFSRWVTRCAGVFMILMMIAGALQLVYALSFAFHADALVTRAVHAFDESAERIAKGTFRLQTDNSEHEEQQEQEQEQEQQEQQEQGKVQPSRPLANHEEAMKRALTALEMLLLAPLPYLLMVGLTRYIKALAFRERVDEFRRELLDYKSFEVALFIAIVAAATVSRVLAGDLDWEMAAAAALIIGVLTVYFFIIEKRAHEDEELDLEREKALYSRESKVLTKDPAAKGTEADDPEAKDPKPKT